MPGIAAIISNHPSRESGTTLDRMLGVLRHQPDYCSSSFHNEAMNFWAGGVSHPGGFDDCLPIWNEGRDAALVFSGEVFPEDAEVQDLRARGHRFEPGNGSYLIHSYEEHGLNFVERLNGGFSGILLDLRRKRIAVFNDRFGMNRIYVHEDEDTIYLCSEAKGLLQVKPTLRSLDQRGFAEFLACGCILQNRTLFSGISLLPPGACWEFERGQAPRKRTYFDAGLWEQQSVLSGSDYYDSFREAWKRILPRYFRGHNAVGMSLTGGVDSRMILAWVPTGAREIPCYTFSGSYRDCADVKLSRDVARTCHLPHHTIPVGREFLAAFPKLAEESIYLSDGTMDVLGAIDLYLQETACRIAPIRVTGTNGGEILRRIVAFKPSRLASGLLSEDMEGKLQAAAETYAQELQGNPLSFTAFKQAPWLLASKFVLERARLTLRMPYFDNELVQLSYRTPAEWTQDNGLSMRLISEGNPALARIPTDRRAASGNGALWPAARGLIQEFTFKAEYAYDSGMPQWLAKFDHVAAPLHLERLFLGRHKFSHFRVWYRDQLSDYVRDMLLDPRTRARPYWKGTALERMVGEHLKGTANYTTEIHKILSAELMFRRLIESN